MRSYIAFRFPIIVRPNLTPRSEFHESLNEVLGSYLNLSFSPVILLLLNSKDHLSNKAWMVVIITMGVQRLFMSEFPLSVKSLSRIKREWAHSLLSLYIIVLTVNLYPRFHKGVDGFLCFFFFSFFYKKRQEEALNKLLINSVLLIQRCWRRHQRRRENAAVKIQSGKTTTVEVRHTTCISSLLRSLSFSAQTRVQ